MSTTAILYMAILLSGLIGSFALPIVGMLTYMFVYFTASRSEWWFMYLASMGVRTSFLAGIALLLSTLLHRRKLNIGRWGISPIEWGLIIFLCFMWISPYIGYGKTWQTDSIIQTVTKSFIVIFCMTRVVTRVEHYIAIRWMWVLSGLYLGFNVMLEGEEVFLGGRLDSVGGGDFSGSSAFAHQLAMTLPFIAGTFLLSKNWLAKGISAFAGAFTLNAIVMTRARGSFLGILLGGLVGLILSPKQYRKKIIILSIIGLIGFVSITDPDFWARMSTITMDDSEMERSSSGRLELWKASLHMFIDHPFGVGVGNFNTFIVKYAPDYRWLSPHNTFVRCYTDLGIQGIVVYLAILMMVFSKLRQLQVRQRNNEFAHDYGGEAYIIGIALVVGLAAGMFTERLFSESIWWLVAMTICLDRLFIREQESREEGGRIDSANRARAGKKENAYQL